MFCLQKIGLLILFNFFQMAKFEIFLLVIYTISAFGLYYIFNNNMYFYRKKLISLCSFQHLIIFWTGFVLLISYVNYFILFFEKIISHCLIGFAKYSIPGSIVPLGEWIDSINLDFDYYGGFQASFALY